MDYGCIGEDARRPPETRGKCEWVEQIGDADRSSTECIMLSRRSEEPARNSFPRICNLGKGNGIGEIRQCVEEADGKRRRACIRQEREQREEKRWLCAQQRQWKYNSHPLRFRT
jgi:hypothetical protein